VAILLDIGKFQSRERKVFPGSQFARPPEFVACQIKFARQSVKVRRAETKASRFRVCCSDRVCNNSIPSGYEL